jgi:hypothetical protein
MCGRTTRRISDERPDKALHRGDLPPGQNPWGQHGPGMPVYSDPSQAGGGGYFPQRQPLQSASIAPNPDPSGLVGSSNAMQFCAATLDMIRAASKQSTSETGSKESMAKMESVVEGLREELTKLQVQTASKIAQLDGKVRALKSQVQRLEDHLADSGCEYE